MYGIYTLPVNLVRKGLNLVGVKLDTSLLAEFLIIIYQYTAVAFSFGVTIGIINLVMFYLIGGLFDWCEKLLRVDTNNFLPTLLPTKQNVKDSIQRISEPVKEILPVERLLPVEEMETEEEIVPVEETRREPVKAQLSLHGEADNSFRRRNVPTAYNKSSAHRADTSGTRTDTAFDTGEVDTTVATTFTDLIPGSASEITELTENKENKENKE